MRLAAWMPSRSLTIDTTWPVDVALVEAQKRVGARRFSRIGPHPFGVRKVTAREIKLSLQASQATTAPSLGGDHSCRDGRPVRMAVMLLLVPSDPLAPSRPDEHFVPEANAANAAGIEGAVIDHGAVVACDDA